jgi:hypothetical protein
MSYKLNMPQYTNKIQQGVQIKYVIIKRKVHNQRY